MKIKTKLNVLMLGTFLMLGLAALAWWLVQSPLDRMAGERQILNQVASAAHDAQSQFNRLMSDSFGQRKPLLDEALGKWTDALANTVAITYLPGISPAVADAIGSIRSLGDLTGPGIERFNTAWPDLQQDALRLLLNKSSATIPKFFGEIPTTPDGHMDADARTHISAFLNQLESLNRNFDAVISTISEQNALIDAEMDLVRQRSAVVVGILLFFIVALTLFLSWLITRSISRSVKAIALPIQQMASGDLTGCVRLASNDELGSLGQDLDNLLNGLNQSIAFIQHAAAENARLRHELNETVVQASSSSTEIEAGTRSIGSQMERLDTMLESSHKGMGQMAEAMESLKAGIAGQDGQVQGARASIERMFASIVAINRITDRDLAAATELVREAEAGRQVFETTFEQINQIAGRIGQIQDMAQVIADIARQTNILAMNAAIESAHAGEYGKGFAVVADEITKLAAASAASSEEISQTISGIIGNITDAAGSSEHMARSLGSISERIAAASSSSREIHGNISQVQSENQQIQALMDQLHANSQSIRQESRTMDQSLSERGEIVASMSRISREVVSNITEITRGLAEITAVVRLVSGQAERIGTISNGLDQAINHYRTSGCVDLE